MQYRTTAFLAGLLLVLSSHFTFATEATLKDVNRALASPEPVVLIGVPAKFLHPETIDGDAAETQADWVAYLNEWIKKSADKKKLKIIVVRLNILARALQTPVLKGDCATLFLKNRTEGLLYDEDCVPQFDIYDAGANWLQGTAPSGEAARDLKATAIVARVRAK